MAYGQKASSCDPLSFQFNILLKCHILILYRKWPFQIYLQAYKKCSVCLGPSKVMGKIFCQICARSTHHKHISVKSLWAEFRPRAFWGSLVQSAPIFEPFLCKYYYFLVFSFEHFLWSQFLGGPAVPRSCGFCRPVYLLESKSCHLKLLASDLGDISRAPLLQNYANPASALSLLRWPIITQILQSELLGKRTKVNSYCGFFKKYYCGDSVEDTRYGIWHKIT